MRGNVEPLEVRFTRGEERGYVLDTSLRLHGLPLRWTTEITSWDPLDGFEDEQRQGPYDFWRHEHEFRETDEDTLVLDRVHYAMLLG